MTENVNAADRHGHTPLIDAARGGNVELVEDLLRRGAEGMTSTVIEDSIDRLGAEMAVDTGASSVAMHAQVISRSLDAFVDLVTNLISRPTFPENEFERLRREALALVESEPARCQGGSHLVVLRR